MAALMLNACTTLPPARPTPEATASPATVLAPASQVTPVRSAPRIVATSRTPAPAAPLPERMAEEPLRVSAQSVFFPIGSNDITNPGHRLLQDVAERIKGKPRMHVTLIGHTDDAGSAEFNIALAQRRVDTVSSELISLGVSGRQIRRISYGDEAGGGLSCATETCRQQKRRVELRLSDD